MSTTSSQKSKKSSNASADADPRNKPPPSRITELFDDLDSPENERVLAAAFALVSRSNRQQQPPRLESTGNKDVNSSTPFAVSAGSDNENSSLDVTGNYSRTNNNRSMATQKLNLTVPSAARTNIKTGPTFSVNIESEAQRLHHGHIDNYDSSSVPLKSIHRTSSAVGMDNGDTNQDSLSVSSRSRLLRSSAFGMDTFASSSVPPQSHLPKSSAMGMDNGVSYISTVKKAQCLSDGDSDVDSLSVPLQSRTRVSSAVGMDNGISVFDSLSVPFHSNTTKANIGTQRKAQRPSDGVSDIIGFSDASAIGMSYGKTPVHTEQTRQQQAGPSTNYPNNTTSRPPQLTSQKPLARSQPTTSTVLDNALAAATPALAAQSPVRSLHGRPTWRHQQTSISLPRPLQSADGIDEDSLGLEFLTPNSLDPIVATKIKLENQIRRVQLFMTEQSRVEPPKTHLRRDDGEDSVRSLLTADDSVASTVRSMRSVQRQLQHEAEMNRAQREIARLRAEAATMKQQSMGDDVFRERGTTTTTSMPAHLDAYNRTSLQMDDRDTETSEKAHATLHQSGSKQDASQAARSEGDDYFSATGIQAILRQHYMDADAAHALLSEATNRSSQLADAVQELTETISKLVKQTSDAQERYRHLRDITDAYQNDARFARHLIETGRTFEATLKIQQETIERATAHLRQTYD